MIRTSKGERLAEKKGVEMGEKAAPLSSAPSSGCGGNCVVSAWSKGAEIKGKRVSDVRVVVGIGRVNFIPCSLQLAVLFKKIIRVLVTFNVAYVECQFFKSKF